MIMQLIYLFLGNVVGICVVRAILDSDYRRENLIVALLATVVCLALWAGGL